MDMIQEYIWFALGGAAFVAFLLGLIIYLLCRAFLPRAGVS